MKLKKKKKKKKKLPDEAKFRLNEIKKNRNLLSRGD